MVIKETSKITPKKNKDEKKEVPEYIKIEKTKKFIYFDTVYTSIKEGINSNFILPYAIALKAPNDFIAIISATPGLVGSFFQLFASDLLNIIKSRRKVIFFTAFIDALLWIPILLLPFLWGNNYVLLLNFLIIQSISRAILNPFYNSLLGDIIPNEKRGIIFSRINQVSGMLSLFSSLIAGFVLSVFKNINPFFGFSIIFFVAFFSRLISAFIKNRFYEPELKQVQKGESLFHFSLNIRKSNFGQFVMYSSWMKFAVGISAPFFTVYMLKYLNMDFLTYSLINGAAIISSFIVLNKWGKNIDQKGSRWMLGISGLLVPIVPIFWIFFKQSVILFIIELFSGAVWAAYNLSTSNFVLDSTKREDRLLMLSYFNFFIGVATFFGAIIGGNLMKHLPADFLGNIFYFIFGLSALLRLMFSLYFLRKIKSEKFVDLESISPLEKRITSFLPKEGAIWQFIPHKKR